MNLFDITQRMIKNIFKVILLGATFSIANTTYANDENLAEFSCRYNTVNGVSYVRIWGKTFNQYEQVPLKKMEFNSASERNLALKHCNVWIDKFAIKETETVRIGKIIPLETPGPIRYVIETPTGERVEDTGVIAAFSEVWNQRAAHILAENPEELLEKTAELITEKIGSELKRYNVTVKERVTLSSHRTWSHIEP